jgi:predicted transporter
VSGNGSNGNGDHSIAVWAGVTTFFINVAAINLVRLLGDTADAGWQALAALVTALVVAAGVYSKQRWDEAKEAQERKRKSRRPSRPDGA